MTATTGTAVDAQAVVRRILDPIPADQMPDVTGLLDLVLKANEACRAAIDAAHEVSTHFVEPLLPDDLPFAAECQVVDALKDALHLTMTESVLLEASEILASDDLLCPRFEDARTKRIDLTPARTLLAQLRQEATP